MQIDLDEQQAQRPNNAGPVEFRSDWEVYLSMAAPTIEPYSVQEPS